MFLIGSGGRITGQGAFFLRRHDPMMYYHEVSRGPMKIYYADMSRGPGGICYLEVSSIGSSTCLTRSICFSDVSSVRCGVCCHGGV